MSYCLAIDIGASSGRHILGEYAGGKIVTTEIYRFENGIKEINGSLCWDVEHLFKCVLDGIKKCSEIGKYPDRIAIDTWGVDYVLLDENCNEIMPAISYRDARTTGAIEAVDEIISREELYSKTGIQRVNYNSIYQLYCDKKSGKLEKARHFLLMPEYLSYKLTGVMKSEYTIASTTSLINAEKRQWDRDIIEKLGFDFSIFNEVCSPGEEVGYFTDEVREYVGFNSKVVFAPSHDTASAVSAITDTANSMYISSGTWSLIGVVAEKPCVNEKALEANFTNEGGVKGTYRFLKNIMGMWLFQNISKNLDKKFSYDEMMKMAMESDFKETFDPNDQRLVAPVNMIGAIKECLGNDDLELKDVLNSVYHSLAKSYARVVDEIEDIIGEKITGICIAGGGSKDTYLNSLTQSYTGKTVTVGPTEATALGNLKTQFGI